MRITNASAAIVAATVLFIAGCAGSPARISMMQSEELAEVQDLQLCSAYRIAQRSDGPSRVETEIRRRNLIPDQEWASIADEKVFIGMTACGALASWGPPTTVNSTTTRHGSRHQWVYRGGGYSVASNYLYIQAGKVSGIQN